MKHSLIRVLIGVLFATSSLASGCAMAAPYPADIAAWTETTKQQQRTAGAQLITNIVAAQRSGQASYTIPAGNYRFGTTTTQGSRQVFIKLTDMDNFVIDGNQATFWFEDDRLGMYIGSSTNLTIKNLNIDWDPLPFTQGTIVSIDSVNKTMRVQLAAGYNRVTPRFAALASSASNPEVRGAVFTSDGKFKSKQNLFRGWPFLSSGPNADGTYTVSIAPFYSQGTSSLNAVAGDRIAFWIRGDGAFLLEGCENVTLTNIDVFASSGISFKDAGCKGPITYRDCNIATRSGTDRLINGNADGFHSENAQFGPLIEQCDVKSIGDDGINVHGYFYKVLAQESPRSVIVQQIAYRGDLGSLDYDFTRAGDYAPLGRRTGTATRLTYNGVQAHRLTLTADISVQPNDMVACDNFVGQNATIRNNTFNNILTRGILYRSHHGLIDTNTISWTGMYGIACLPQPESWGEATYIHDLKVLNNTLTDTYVSSNADGRSLTRGGIYIYAPGYSVGARQKILEVGSNTITRPGSHGIAALGVSTLTMWYNNINSYGNLLAGNGIDLTTASGLSMGGNTFSAGTYGGSNTAQR